MVAPPQRQHTGQIWRWRVQISFEICFFCLQLNIKRTHLAWQQSFACLASRPPSVREIFRQRKKSWWQRPCHLNDNIERTNTLILYLWHHDISLITLFVAWKYPKPENIPRLTPGHGVSHSPFPTWQLCKYSLLSWQFSMLVDLVSCLIVCHLDNCPVAPAGEVF